MFLAEPNLGTLSFMFSHRGFYFIDKVLRNFSCQIARALDRDSFGFSFATIGGATFSPLCYYYKSVSVRCWPSSFFFILSCNFSHRSDLRLRVIMCCACILFCWCFSFFVISSNDFQLFCDSFRKLFSTVGSHDDIICWRRGRQWRGSMVMTYKFHKVVFVKFVKLWK